jgi:hypothetical protein
MNNWIKNASSIPSWIKNREPDHLSWPLNEVPMIGILKAHHSSKNIKVSG